MKKTDVNNEENKGTEIEITNEELETANKE